MNLESYLAALAAQLERRGAGENRIAEVVAEVESHLADSGEQPLDAFGPADRYAEEMTAFEEKKADNSSISQWHKRTFRATALDEMETLKWVGEEGWEMMDVGAYALNCRRPQDQNLAGKWRYIRRTGTNRRSITEEMINSNWEPCGNWIVFHYFKQKTDA